MKSVKLAVFCASTVLVSVASVTMAQDGTQKPERGAGYGACPGWGGGPGMMGSYGPGLGPYGRLNLSDQQRIQINQIQEQVRQRHWNLMGQMRDESARLRGMMATDRPDPAAVGQQQMKVADIHRQMLESSVEARNRIEAFLTNEQKAQLRSMVSRRWSADPGFSGAEPDAATGGK